MKVNSIRETHRIADGNVPNPRFPHIDCPVDEPEPLHSHFRTHVHFPYLLGCLFERVDEDRRDIVVELEEEFAGM